MSAVNKRYRYLPLLIGLILLLSLGNGCRFPGEDTLLIANAMIVVAERDEISPPQDILIEDGVITIVSTAGGIPHHWASKVIDATGRYLLPGLIDVHAHIGDGGIGEQSRADREQALAQFVRYGVTTIFVPGGGAGNDDDLVQWKQRCANGELLCPKLYGSGALLTAPGSHPISTLWNFGLDADSAAVYARGATIVTENTDLDALMDRKVHNGVDGIKIIIEDWGGEVPRLTLPLIQAITEAAHARALPVFAHVSWDDHVEDGISAGLDGFMHSIEAPLSDEMLMAMADQDIFFVPTFSLYQGFFSRAEGPLQVDPFMEAGVSERARSSLVDFDETPFESPELVEEVRGIIQENYSRAHRFGVPLALGTDVNNPGVFPGYAAHQELELMVEAGLTPAEALHAATSGGAAFLRVSDSVGKVAPGFEADLLILAQNPLDHIVHTRLIVTLVMDGEVIEEHTGYLAN